MDELLTARCGSISTGDYFGRSWSALWAELVSGGWLDVGASLRQESPAADALCDLGLVVEVWGRHLVPLPFVELALRSFMYGATGVTDSLPIGTGDGTVLVTRPLEPETEEGASAGVSAPETMVCQRDAFAPSLPVVRRRGPLPSTAEEIATAAALWAAEGVGCASAAFAKALEYSRERRAYGRQIGSYQAIQHLFADSYRDLELARSGVVWAAHDSVRAPLAASDALRRANTVVANTIQIHGGVGFTWEYGLHFHLRHIMVLQQLLRTAGSGAPVAANGKAS